LLRKKCSPKGERMRGRGRARKGEGEGEGEGEGARRMVMARAMARAHARTRAGAGAHASMRGRERMRGRGHRRGCIIYIWRGAESKVERAKARVSARARSATSMPSAREGKQGPQHESRQGDCESSGLDEAGETPPAGARTFLIARRVQDIRGFVLLPPFRQRFNMTSNLACGT